MSRRHLHIHSLTLLLRQLCLALTRYVWPFTVATPSHLPPDFGSVVLMLWVNVRHMLKTVALCCSKQIAVEFSRAVKRSTVKAKRSLGRCWILPTEPSCFRFITVINSFVRGGTCRVRSSAYTSQNVSGCYCFKLRKKRHLCLSRFSNRPV